MEFTGRARAIFAVTFLTLGVVLAVGFATVSTSDWPFAPGAKVGEVRNLTGPFGSLLSWTAIELFGRVFAWLLPLVLLVLAVNAAGALSMMRRWRSAPRGAWDCTWSASSSTPWNTNTSTDRARSF